MVCTAIPCRIASRSSLNFLPFASDDDIATINNYFAGSGILDQE